MCAGILELALVQTDGKLSLKGTPQDSNEHPPPPATLEGKLRPLGREIKSHTHILRYSALM